MKNLVTIAFFLQAKRLITNEFAAIKVIKLEPGIVDVCLFLEGFNTDCHFHKKTLPIEIHAYTDANSITKTITQTQTKSYIYVYLQS